MSTSILNAGHGANDPGAVANGLIERDINKAVVLKAKEFMQYNGINVEIIIDTPDVNAVVAKVNEIASKTKVGIAQSVHMNAGGGDGYEVYHSIFYGQATVFAKILEEEFAKTGQNAHGTGDFSRKSSNGNYDYYGFIRDTDPSAVISEYAFLDNINDVEQAKQIEVQARAIAKAHCRYYGIEYKEKTDVTHIASTSNEKVEIPTGKNITPLGDVGYIEILPERVIIHYDKYNYISIGKDGIYAYAKNKSCVQII